MLLTETDYIQLVEGDIDKDYFELLRNPDHGANQLKFTGKIFSYDGRDNLKNTVLLKFIMERYRHVFVTYNLDAEDVIENCIQKLRLIKKKDYEPVGLNKTGKKNMEGLVPESVTGSVYGANLELVQKAMSSNKDEARSAKKRLKRMIFEEFKA